MNNNERKAAIFAGYLERHGVPYYKNVRSNFLVMGFKNHTEQIQFTFDWCDGDVIMDTCSKFNGEEDEYVESYGFPWDGEGDITRDYPRDMAYKVIDYYEAIQEGA